MTGLTLGGAAEGNYTLASTSVTGAVGEIDAKTLTASLTGTVQKTYDGTTTATLASGNYLLSGIVGSEVVTLNDPMAGTYDTKNVGTGKIVSVTGLALGGAADGNYTLASNMISGLVGQILAAAGGGSPPPQNQGAGGQSAQPANITMVPSTVIQTSSSLTMPVSPFHNIFPDAWGEPSASSLNITINDQAEAAGNSAVTPPNGQLRVDVDLLSTLNMTQESIEGWADGILYR